MKGKRTKQYRKLMKQYARTFGFREPYQVLVDTQMLLDTHRFSMDLSTSLTRTLSGTTKPMMTQCSMRHLYALPLSSHPKKEHIIATARTLERRRCGHHTLDQPLSEMECFKSVVDPKSGVKAAEGGPLVNRFNYVVAVQDEEIRRWCRGVRGTPLVYVKRSVMVMEPMADASVRLREGEERGKMRVGLREKVRGAEAGVKRKRGDEEVVVGKEGEDGGGKAAEEREAKKSKKVPGPKGPNPLSVMKPKKENGVRAPRAIASSEKALTDRSFGDTGEGLEAGRSEAVESVVMSKAQNPSSARRRKRKHKSKGSDGLEAGVANEDKDEVL